MMLSFLSMLHLQSGWMFRNLRAPYTPKNKLVMYIRYCPIPFHDFDEIWEFLLALSPQMATIFDGCYLLGVPIQFYSLYTPDYRQRYLYYKLHRE